MTPAVYGVIALDILIRNFPVLTLRYPALCVLNHKRNVREWKCNCKHSERQCSVPFSDQIHGIHAWHGLRLYFIVNNSSWQSLPLKFMCLHMIILSVFFHSLNLNTCICFCFMNWTRGLRNSFPRVCIFVLEQVSNHAKWLKICKINDYLIFEEPQTSHSSVSNTYICLSSFVKHMHLFDCRKCRDKIMRDPTSVAL